MTHINYELLFITCYLLVICTYFNDRNTCVPFPSFFLTFCNCSHNIAFLSLSVYNLVKKHYTKLGISYFLQLPYFKKKKSKTVGEGGGWGMRT